ncbi:MAG: lipid kinase [Acetobacteraceae bacterium]
MTPRRALLLINPSSRRGAEAAPAVFAALTHAGIGLMTAPGKAGIADAIRAHADQVDCVIVGGGDGTLNAAAKAVIETGLPLGVIPLGTANDFARTLGIPLDPRAAAAVIAAGHTTPVDVGDVNGHAFLNVASIGFGVDLTRALTRDSKRRWGALGYAVAGLRALGRLQPFTAEIEHGGHVDVTRTVHLAIGNGRHYGGGMVVAEQARLDDGQLHAFSLEVDHWWGLLRLLPALRSGTHHAWSEVKTLAGESLLVRTSRPRSVNTDGEITTKTPALFRVRPAAMRVFVPVLPHPPPDQPEG